MLKPGKSYKPSRMEIMKTGEYTRWSIPQHHTSNRGGNLHKVLDGWIQVMTFGTFDYEEGDEILLKEITAVQQVVSELNGKTYFTVWANVELLKAEKKQQNGNDTYLENDIPEDLI